MRRRPLLQGLVAAALPVAAWADDRIAVVATISILADMAATVGGDAVAVTTLVPVDGDPHAYEPRPGDLRTLQSARVLIENGLGLEGWMSRMVKASGFKGVRITAAAAVKSRTMLEGRSRITDPHAWQDPRNGVLYVRAIADGLARAIPAQEAAIRARAADYISQIEATDRWIQQTLAAIPPSRRRIITSHDAFGYFAARYGITMRGVQGIDTEAEPSARDIATLSAQIRSDHIKAVFVENMTDPRLAATLAKEAGAALGPKVYSDALSPPGGPAATYLAMFRHNVTAFAQAMAANE
ncbi:metal ABC transporter solute-binding protein, Zn/Mn family [Limobrevibacterium gyesilva]|uniref:Zinc ABC transporter substrate-binding protein n=1 Tax=Limobrevibacterium gyesilva TaxID=2991712 RepID=A0AA41YQ10_9PROT|nr:zinc ABC transporter substrate-binding protein [Limobrevibacterium gyesilva]MCW3473427.1 zinc ABC transporter substrate-binding protein [Limobrevibacterium gyesilva]